MSDTTAADRMTLAENWIADIVRIDEDSWQIAFLDASGVARPIAVPSLSVEAISSDQIARNLKLRPGAAPNHVVAEGWVEFATHARITIAAPSGAVLRQHRFADAPVIAADAGPKGGFLADMGHGAHVEVLRAGGPDWSLVFYNGGAECPAPGAEAITLDTVDHEGRVQTFAASPSAEGSTLRVNTGDARPVRLRVSWAHGDHAHRREFDLPQI
jgi:hypothetical protein